jgi:hypothetical protein
VKEAAARGGRIVGLEGADGTRGSSMTVSEDGNGALLARTYSDELVGMLGTDLVANSGRLREVVTGLVAVIESQ